MKLRYCLFTWVGVLFAVAFIISLYVEVHVTRINLQETRQSLVTKLYKKNEEKRQSIEAYLADMLWRIQAQIDAVLQGVSNYTVIQKGFAPTDKNLTHGTWLNSTSLMITNQWLGFIQNISGDQLLSEIIVHPKKLMDTYHFPIAENIHLVAVRDFDNPEDWKGPYIGIAFDLNVWHQIDQSDATKKIDNSYFVFFKPQTLFKLDMEDIKKENLGLSVNLLEPFLKWVKVSDESFFLQDFVERIKNAQILIKTNPHVIPSRDKWNHLIETKNHSNPNHDMISLPSFLNDDSQKSSTPEEKYYQQQILRYERNYIERYNQVGLVWGLSTLNDTKLFDNHPIAPNGPEGIGVVNNDTLNGKGLQSKMVFSDKIEYDIEKALQGMELPNDFLTTHLDIITSKNYQNIFFGNTLKLQDPVSKRTGYLTLGAHGGPVLSALARATHQMSMFITNDRIVAVCNPNGEEVSVESPWYRISVDELKNKVSGIINFEGKEYFFLHIAPYKEIDLHFFIFNLKSKEFQFIDSVSKAEKPLIRKLSMQMRLSAIGALVIVLILLNSIAKRVTKPIAHLVKVTEAVAGGKLYEIEIPEKAKKKSNSEIYALYNSFFEMVKGLREKEKVRGVLNKVVSKEIAEETLKGNIQLGGEEKQATVFFADIRQFTSMTEHMDPKDVIQLINKCMTKISTKIDEYGGVIDKYVGDEVMALFGAPIAKEESALHAIKCAVDIIETFKHWNQEREANNELPIYLGIGIHTGTLVAGNMGAEDRLNYTVLGANVNLASRLCGQAQSMQILISSDTLDEKDVKRNIEVESVPDIELKGFTKTIAVFSVKGYSNSVSDSL